MIRPVIALLMPLFIFGVSLNGMIYGSPNPRQTTVSLETELDSTEKDQSIF